MIKEQRSQHRHGALKFLLAGFAGLTILYLSMLSIKTNEIQIKLLANVEQVLFDAGYHRLNATINGRDIVLQGKTSSSRALQSALSLVAAVPGIRTVHATTSIDPLRLPHVRLVRGRDNMIRIAGELPDEITLNSIKQGLGTAIISDLRIDPELSIPIWIEAVGQLVNIAHELESYSFEIGAGRLEFSGITIDGTTYRRVFSNLQELSAKFELELINRIATIKP